MPLKIRNLTSIVPQALRFQLRRLFFAGLACRCELCGSRFRAWLSHGGGSRINERRQVVGAMLRERDRCPVCHSRDRTRLMMLWLRDIGCLGNRPTSVLHIAPDYGLYLWLRRQQDVEYTGSDLDRVRYRHISNFVEADLTSLPFVDNRFDYVICSHVLEHVPDDISALREILRVLKPRGAALLLVPESIDGGLPDEDPSVVTAEEREARFGQWDHVRLYTRELFSTRLEGVGFHLEIFDPLSLFANGAEAARLNPLERMRIARKPMG